MTLSKAIKEIRDLITTSLQQANYPLVEYDVSEPPRKDFGDLTANVAFLLSKKIAKKPYIISVELIEKYFLPYIEKNSEESFISSVEAHSAGHINFKINYNIYNKFILDIVKRKKIDFPSLGNDKEITIEHTSINPNKALHIGHLRNIVIGDTLYRLFKYTNYQTKVLNYIDDSGVQVADIIVAFKFAGFNHQPSEKSIKFDHYCGDIYVKMTQLYRDNPEILEKRKFIIKEIEKGDTELSKFTTDIVDKVLNEQLKTCWRLKARYDILNIESQILSSRLWENTFNLLKYKNIVQYSEEGKNKNCWIVKPIDETQEEKVLVRSDGTVTYIAKDIPYAAWKLKLVDDPFNYIDFAKQWDGSILLKTKIKDLNQDNSKKSSIEFFHEKKKLNPYKIITIIDSRQSRLQKIISEIMHELDPLVKRYYYLGYETVTLSSETVKFLGFETKKENDRQIVHMSGREGIFVNADDVLDQLHKKAFAEIKNRNSEFNNIEVDIIAEAITVSAIRYSLIKQDLDKMITFDIKEALNLDGDTSLYLQYSYVRAIRIFEKSENILELRKNIDVHLLNHEIEKDLIKELGKFDILIEEAVLTLNPKILARYTNRLATKFNVFYENIMVLSENVFDLKLARLSLIKAFVIVLSSMFSILGVEVLKRI